MAQGKSVAPEVALFLQARLRDLLANGMAPSEVAKRIGVTKGQISQLKNHAAGVGFKTLTGMAGILNLTIDQVFTKAAAWGKEHPDVVAALRNERVEYPERYPNRLLAAEVARREGISEEAILNVVGWALKASEDPGPLEWFEDMRSEDRRLKRQASEAKAARGHAMAQARIEQVAAAREFSEKTRGSIPAKPEPKK